MDSLFRKLIPMLRYSLFCMALFQFWAVTDSKGVADENKAESPKDWKILFDGKSLKNWKSIEFGGEGEVTLEEGNMVLSYGVDLTGVNYVKPLPKNNFEIELEAKRVDGSDFFCGLTFMVDESPCSLIIGGWGGGLCGLSSLDGNDASENETATYQEFEKGKWYKIRLKVHQDRIQAWIGDKQIVNVDISDRKLTIRAEVELSLPFGIATWKTTGALRNIKIREIPAE